MASVVTVRTPRWKRAVDLAVTIPVTIVAAPVMAAVAVAVRVRLGGPVLFRQQRPGLGGEIFELVKFRTMLPEGPGRTDDASRMTRLGSFLRSTSLDELPELFNVLKGDMSLVGPRPLLVSYLPLYSEEQARRHEVRPGVTGLAQVSGRNALSWEEKFALDVQYVDSLSPRMDALILWRTIRTVLSRGGVSSEGEATAAPFTGSEPERSE